METTSDHQHEYCGDTSVPQGLSPVEKQVARIGEDMAGRKGPARITRFRVSFARDVRESCRILTLLRHLASELTKTFFVLMALGSVVYFSLSSRSAIARAHEIMLYFFALLYLLQHFLKTLQARDDESRRPKSRKRYRPKGRTAPDPVDEGALTEPVVH